jgi:hypothetical protein
MANLLTAQQYIDAGNHEAAIEVLESALRDNPRDRSALKLLHTLERSSTQVIPVIESPPPSLSLSAEQTISPEIEQMAVQIFKSANDGLIVAYIIGAVGIVGLIGWGLWALIGWVQTVDVNAMYDIADSLIGLYYIPLGVFLGLAIMGHIVMAFRKAFKD